MIHYSRIFGTSKKKMFEMLPRIFLDRNKEDREGHPCSTYFVT